MNTSSRSGGAIRRQRGYTLIEIMIALLVALFLLAGLGTLVAGTRRTGSNQMSLAQLQDEQRLAMSILNDVVQKAGYFNTNSYYTATDAWPAATTVPASGAALAVGQILTGTHNTSISVPDTLAVRYSTSGTDGIINCAGGTSTTAATYINYFFVNTATTPNQLQCSSDGQTGDAVSLVNDVVNMQIWYGLSTGGGSSANVDTYMTADQVTALTNGWFQVTSLRVTLTFKNPLSGQPGQPPYVYFTRVIALQSRAGAVFP